MCSAMIKIKKTFRAKKFKMRHELYCALEETGKTKQSAIWVDIFLQILILLNVVAVLLETVDSVYSSYRSIFIWFETYSIMVFTVEYISRVWISVENSKFKHPVLGRIRYLFTFNAVIDLLAIIPFYLMFIGINLDLRMLRMLRLLKLIRYSSALQSFGRVFYQKRDQILTSFFVFLFFLVATSSIVYWAEKDIQPEAFSSIPAAMWWGIATLTTVGYGDMYPVTAIGKIFGSMSAIIGIAMYALPSAIIVTGFISEISSKNKERHTSNEKTASGNRNSNRRRRIHTTANRSQTQKEQSRTSNKK